MTSQRRVCLLPPADLLPDAGSTLYSRLLACELTEAGCDVTVVCARSHESLAVRTILAPIPLRHPFDHHQGTPNTVFADATAVTVDAILRQWNPQPGDVVHAVYAGYSALAAGIVSALSGSLTVVSELGRMVNLAAVREARYRRLAALAFTTADHVIAATTELANRIQREFCVARERVTVLPVPLDVRAFAAPPRAREARQLDTPLVITTICSCLTPEKGVMDLVEAFAIARTHVDRPLQLRIVGADPVPGHPTRTALEQRIGGLGIESAVSLTGYRPQQEIPDILADADIYVDARRVGNFSSVIAEAMAMRRPIVASNVSSNAAFLEDGRDALLFDSGHIPSLASALVRLVDETHTRDRLSRNAGEWSTRQSTLLSPRAHAAAVIRIYDAVSSAEKVSQVR